MNTNCWEYAAGIIDGEGCIRINHIYHSRTGSSSFIPSVEVSNTNMKLLKWFKYLFGGGISGGTSTWKNGYRRLRKWRLNGGEAVKFLNKIYPFLFVKQDQARIVASCYDEYFNLDLALSLLNSLNRQGVQS